MTALYYDYILEINLKQRQTFYSVVMIICYLIKIDVGEDHAIKGEHILHAVLQLGPNNTVYWVQIACSIASPDICL